MIRHAIPAHRADAVKVKAFIRSLGVLGKTDAIDARSLAEYGAERRSRLAFWKPVDKDRKHLQALILRRRDLVAMRQAETNRFKAPGNQPIRRSLRQLIRHLEKQIRAVDVQTEQLTNDSSSLKETIILIRAMPCVGPVTATSLIALMPGLGTLTRRQAAALAGLAPHPRDSGKTSGYRRIRGARADIRAVFFMAALAAVRHKPAMKNFYNRLIYNQKRKIVAIIAVMRKIIVILNAKLRANLSLKQS